MMAFPRETEEQIKRRVLDICQDHIRKVLESVRELTLMIDNFVARRNLNELQDQLIRIGKLKEEAAEHKRALLKELAEAGMLLLSREDLLRLVVQMNEIADFSEGAAFRVFQINDRKWEVSDELKNDLLNLAKNVLKTVTALREIIFTLSYSRSKAIELAKNVEIAEYAVDEIYRNVEMKIIDGKMDVARTLILRDIAQILEDIADKAEDAADATRILALGI